jgi:hypothetical protein
MCCGLRPRFKNLLWYGLKGKYQNPYDKCEYFIVDKYCITIFPESWVPPTQKFDIYLENNYNECQTVRVTPYAPPATLATAVVVL